jgi:cysteine desulfurase
MLAAGLGAASRLASDLAWTERVRTLRDSFWTSLRARRVVANGHPGQRLPNTLNLSFVGRHGADILAGLEGVAASTGSACHSGRIELSPVLRAIGISEHVGMGAVRFSLGRTTTADEITAVVARLSDFLLRS